MMAAGKYASLPRKPHSDRKCSLVSSMEALDKGGLLSGQHSGYLQGVSIHGTLPRKNSRKPSLPRAGTYGPMDLQPLSLPPRLRNASWSCDVIEEHPSLDAKELHYGQRHIADFTQDYVKANGSFSLCKKELQMLVYTEDGHKMLE